MKSPFTLLAFNFDSPAGRRHSWVLFFKLPLTCGQSPQLGLVLSLIYQHGCARTPPGSAAGSVSASPDSANMPLPMSDGSGAVIDATVTLLTEEWISGFHKVRVDGDKRRSADDSFDMVIRDQWLLHLRRLPTKSRQRAKDGAPSTGGDGMML